MVDGIDERVKECTLRLRWFFDITTNDDKRADMIFIDILTMIYPAGSRYFLFSVHDQKRQRTAVAKRFCDVRVHNNVAIASTIGKTS
mmetsp:Transcript_41647/g.99828  ORF Transcript_41647/g.99828 Transcript_41647/m.99828 type:complete len:87 (-) Transcript_41647:60-320(-)